MFKASSMRNVIFGLILVTFVVPSQASSWSTVVIDKQTRKPVKNAIFVTSWTRYFPGLFSAKTPLGVDEILSDENGKISVEDKFSGPGIVQNHPFVYKPGYKFFILDKKISQIKLERVPTNKDRRSEELSKLRNHNDSVDVSGLKFLKEAIIREEEFIQEDRLQPPRIVGVRGSVQTKATPNRSKSTINETPNKDSEASTKPDPNGVQTLDKKIRDSDFDLEIKLVARQVLFNRYTNDPGMVKELEKMLFDTNNNIDTLDKKIRDSNLDNGIGIIAGLLLEYSKDPKAIEVLGNILLDQDLKYEIRWGAEGRLEKSNDPRAVDFLIKALLNDKDKNIRQKVAINLGKKHDSRTVEPLIKAIINDSNDVSQFARFSLDEIGAPATDILLKVLNDGDKKSQEAAASALEKIKDPKLIDPLIKLLKMNDKSLSVGAARGLGKFKESRVTKALIEALSINDIPCFRNEIAGALNEMGPQRVDDLIPELGNKDPENRIVIIRILGISKDMKAVDPLIALLNDKNNKVRSNVIYYLAGFNSPKSVEPIMAIWNDEDTDFRAKASQALIIIGKPAVAALISKLHDKDPYIRWRAAVCLRFIKELEAREALTGALEDEAPEVKWTAIRALGEFGDIRVVEKLSTFCSDRDSGLKENAETAISSLTGKLACH